MDKWFMKRVIDREMSLILVLEKLGVVQQGEYEVDRTCFCCFHENTETKSAKVYNDERGIALFCFAEQRLYRSSDAFERFSNYSIESVFNSVWSRLSNDRKNYYMDKFAVQEDMLSDNWKEALKKMEAFKSGNISYDELLDIVLEVSHAEGSN